MPAKISHNANLHRISRSMSVHYDRAANQIEQLSSGNGINGAGDDPASLALADTLALEVRVLTEGNRNILQSIHMLQVADGALSDMVLRMRSLAVQASTANFNNCGCQNMDSEFQALRQDD